MRIARCSHFAAFLFGFGFSLLSAQSPAPVPPRVGTAVTDLLSETSAHGVEPQIVRISLTEGDVRVARGKSKAKITGAAWEQAVQDLPLESGFNLVTGEGRAEIEFEDASTLYLAANSAMRFNDLSTKDGVPHTDMILLAGTVTLHLRPTFAGETYTFQTPVYKSGTAFPSHTYMRVSSFLDGMKITPFEETSIAMDHGTQVAQPLGKTATYDLQGFAGFRRMPADDKLAAWDAWVAARLSTRAKATESVMQAAGVSSPLPGITGLEGQGTFVDCPPYGRCWAPTAGWGSQENGSATTANQAVSQPTGAAQAPQSAPSSKTTAAYTPASASEDVYDEFPCWYWWMRHNLYRNVLYTNALYGQWYPYEWTVCHTGSWIVRQHRYMWVAGERRHHHLPVRWVKCGDRIGFVPRHPFDRSNRPPENLRHGILTPGKVNAPVERIAFDGRSRIKVLDGPPKEFRSLPVLALAKTEPPQVEAHLVHEPAHLPLLPGGKVIQPAQSLHLNFDRKSQGFVLGNRVTEGGRTSTFTQHFGEKGGSFQNGGLMREGSSWTGGNMSNAGAYYRGQIGHGASNGGEAGRGSSAAYAGGNAPQHSGSSSYNGFPSYGGGGGNFHGGAPSVGSASVTASSPGPASSPSTSAASGGAAPAHANPR